MREIVKPSRFRWRCVEHDVPFRTSPREPLNRLSLHVRFELGGTPQCMLGVHDVEAADPHAVAERTLEFFVLREQAVQWRPAGRMCGLSGACDERDGEA